jgi:zinc transport system permease protein
MMTFIDSIQQAIQYDFILKALLVGSLIAISASVLGLFLVLKKYSMIGDGLAHVSFATVAIALWLSASPLVVSIPIVILASFFILKLSEKASMHGDAAISLVSSFSIAMAVLIASVAKGFNVDLMSYLFGSILVISNFDVAISAALSLVVIVTVLFFYHDLFAVTFDEEYAQAVGMNTKFYNYLLAVLTSITIALGIRIVGTMLISSLIVFPTVTALQVSKGFRMTILIATVISVVCVVLGVFISFAYNLPTGAVIVLMNAIAFALAFLFKALRR